MNVITAKDSNGNELTLDQIKADWAALLVKHEQAKKEDPTWSLFGGVLTVNGHEYQVV